LILCDNLSNLSFIFINKSDQLVNIKIPLQIDNTLYTNWSDWQDTLKSVGAAVSLISSSTIYLISFIKNYIFTFSSIFSIFSVLFF